MKDWLKAEEETLEEKIARIKAQELRKQELIRALHNEQVKQTYKLK